MSETRPQHSSEKTPVRIVEYEPKLSLIMIVKNEAHNLPELLEPIHDKFDEIVVVDTGSTDGTPEVARRYGAKVFFFEWIDDFSAARNESIRRATGDWLFWLDGDDRLERDQVDILRRYAKRAPQRDVVYMCHLASLSSHWSATQNLLQVRLFPKLPGLLYEGAVHERLTESIHRLGLQTDICPVTIVHVGYTDPEKLPAKYERNLRLMERILQERPDDVHTHVQMVLQLLGSGNPQKALDWTERLLELCDRKGLAGDGSRVVALHRFLLLRAMVLAQLNRLEEAAQQCLEVLEEMPKLGTAHFLLAQIYGRMNELENMYAHVLKADHYGIEMDVMPVPMLRTHFDMAMMKAAYYAEHGRWRLAAAEYRAALNINPNVLPLYYEMGQCYYRAGEHRRAVEAYRLGIQLHDEVVENARKKAPHLLESGKELIGTVLELSPEARERWGSLLFAGLSQALRALDKTQEAEEALREGLRRYPSG
ncbi:MAG: hypothetical protein KatS3mg115_1555 [Candidatus Poribacteria bacterium]|nr:MAG: hypothetical protein KatS3mg115_1555 [Candidatus Poribacteria bacterium]